MESFNILIRFHISMCLSVKEVTRCEGEVKNCLCCSESSMVDRIAQKSITMLSPYNCYVLMV